MSLADHLARQRNRDAAERTLMAWIRTCLSLISFGFGLDKIVSAIRSQAAGGAARHGWGVQLISLAFVGTGVVAMLAALNIADQITPYSYQCGLFVFQSLKILPVPASLPLINTL